VRIAEIWTHVTRKLEHAYTVILGGLDQGTDLLGFSSEKNILLSYLLYGKLQWPKKECT